jgi:hypothetical protein
MNPITGYGGLRVVRCWGSHIVWAVGSQMARRLLALCTSRALLPRNFIVCLWYSFLLELEWKNSPHRVSNPQSSGLYHSALTSMLPRLWIFSNSRNPSSRTIAMVFAQPLAEICTRIFLEWSTVGAWGWQHHCYLWADCQENVGPSTSHNLMCLHSLLQDGFTFHSSGMQVLTSVCY